MVACGVCLAARSFARFGHGAGRSVAKFHVDPIVAVALIICGTCVAALPIVAYKLGIDVGVLGFVCYLGLAAFMVISGILGAATKPAGNFTRGFELVAVPESRPNSVAGRTILKS